jgi:hypothetical protein
LQSQASDLPYYLYLYIYFAITGFRSALSVSFENKHYLISTFRTHLPTTLFSPDSVSFFSTLRTDLLWSIEYSIHCSYDDHPISVRIAVNTTASGGGGGGN